ncbi:MAG: biopolymer transporter ExbD [Nitrospirae bacterium]|nr:biopolymer transporter ExbD [Nitrospirota bacterium]MBI3353206.1 biopolymer transporter ExbD [Nitrospirota bacterium]
MNRFEPKKYMAEINVVPLVDVVLVLLIIFMVTAPLLYRGIDLKLPKSEVNTMKAEEGKTISIVKDRKIYFESRLVSLRQLEGQLTTLRQKRPDVTLYLRADRDVSYGEVVQVMDVIKKTGIDRLGMVTDPEGTSPIR